MKHQHYRIDVRTLPAEDGGGFVAIAPDLPGCRSDGETREDASRNGYDAVACWIDAAEKMGRAVPTLPSVVA